MQSHLVVEVALLRKWGGAHVRHSRVLTYREGLTDVGAARGSEGPLAQGA